MTSPTYTSISAKLLEPRLPELGKIKIGGKGKLIKSRNKKEFRLPEKYDHFRVVTGSKNDQDQWIPDGRVHGEVGEKPTELDVRLIFDEPEQNFQYYLAAYDGRTLRCRGNGEEAFDEELGKKIPCTCPLLKQHEGEYKGPKRPVKKVTCKPHGRLSVALEAAETFGGFYVFRTTSWETIRNLSTQLQLFRSQFGFLAGLPLKLVIYPAQDTYESDGETRTSKSYKVALVLRADYQEAARLAAAAYEHRQTLALPSGASMAEAHQRLLKAAEEQEVEEAAAISAEFHPETQEGYVEEADFEVVDEEEEAAAAEVARLEAIIYQTLELADWKKLRINKQLAKYSGRLPELERLVKKEFPTHYKHAVQIIEAAEAQAEEDEADEAAAAEQELAEAEAEGEREQEDADADDEQEEDDELRLL